MLTLRAVKMRLCRAKFCCACCMLMRFNKFLTRVLDENQNYCCGQSEGWGG